MDKKKKKRLTDAGWRVGDAGDFLNLSQAESEYVELKLVLATAFVNRRKALRVSQTTLASKLGSSQSRIAKMEAGDPSVSIDLLVRSLLKLGMDRKALAKILRVSSAA